MNFKSLVEWSVETLSLWQVLNEYNIEDVILHLDSVRHGNCVCSNKLSKIYVDFALLRRNILGSYLSINNYYFPGQI